MKVSKVVVVGSGLRGENIAKCVVKSRFPVSLKDVNSSAVKNAIAGIYQWIDYWESKGYVPEGAGALKKLVSVVDNWKDLNQKGLLVVEAVSEDLKIKQKVFEELEENLPRDAILVSNTSGIISDKPPIAQISKAVRDKSRVAGMHFFQPAEKMDLIEIVRSRETSDEKIDTIFNFSVERLGKHAIVVRDRPGFLVNVLLAGFLRPAVRCVAASQMPLEKIDQKTREFGLPKGPYELIDMVGVDFCAEAMRVFHQVYGPQRFESPDVLEFLIQKERLGKRKSQEGFYDSDGKMTKLYSMLETRFNREPCLFSSHDEAADHTVLKMLVNLVNEASWALYDKTVKTARDIETACVYGLGFPIKKRGPLHWADEYGLEKVLKLINHPCPLLKENVALGETFFHGW